MGSIKQHSVVFEEESLGPLLVVQQVSEMHSGQRLVVLENLLLKIHINKIILTHTG